MGFDTFGPEHIRSPDIWSPTIGPSGQTVPIQFCPHGQMVPNQFGPPGQMVPRILHLSMGIGSGDPEIRGQNGKLVGDHLSRGTKLFETICPWGPYVQGNQFYGDRLSSGTKSGGPDVRGSNWFSTKCVTALIRIIPKGLPP